MLDLLLTDGGLSVNLRSQVLNELREVASWLPLLRVGNRDHVLLADVGELLDHLHAQLHVEVNARGRHREVIGQNHLQRVLCASPSGSEAALEHEVVSWLLSGELCEIRSVGSYRSVLRRH